MSSRHTPMPWPLVLVAGIILPGAGHFLNGERLRGLIIGAAILTLYMLGILIGGIRIIEFPNMNAPGNPIAQLMTQPTFIPEIFAGPITIICGYWSAAVAANPATADIMSHSRVYDIGQIYCSVAGGLNLLALIDATARAFAQSPPRDGPHAEDPAGAA